MDPSGGKLCREMKKVYKIVIAIIVSHSVTHLWESCVLTALTTSRCRQFAGLSSSPSWHAFSAWWGWFASASDLQRFEAFIRHCDRCAWLCPNQPVPTFADLSPVSTTRVVHGPSSQAEYDGPWTRAVNSGSRNRALVRTPTRICLTPSPATVTMFYTTSLPPPSQSRGSQHYDLRQRPHNFTFPSRTGHLTDKDYIQRMLYLNSY